MELSQVVQDLDATAAATAAAAAPTSAALEAPATPAGPVSCFITLQNKTQHKQSQLVAVVSVQGFVSNTVVAVAVAVVAGWPCCFDRNAVIASQPIDTTADCGLICAAADD